MGNVTTVLARVLVEDLDRAIPFYQALTEGAEATRFNVRDVRLARVGSFLLLSGNTNRVSDRVATVRVQSLDPVLAALSAHNGHIVAGPMPGPQGRRVDVRHPDGAVFEYVEGP